MSIQCRNNQQGSGAVVTLLCLLAAGILCMVGSLVYVKNRSNFDPAPPKSIPTVQKASDFESCARLDDSTITTNPIICTTADGAIFARPRTLQTTLDIPVWHVRLELSAAVHDAFVTQRSDGAVRLSSDQYEITLASMQGCRQGFEDLVYQRARPGEIVQGKAYDKQKLQAIGIKAGDYYYFSVEQPKASCAMSPAALVEEAGNLHAELLAAFKTIQPY